MMARSLEGALERIRAADMREVCERLGIAARRSGKGWVALCAFHSERSPSMQIYADHVHCWACHAHADAIALAGHVWGLDVAAGGAAFFECVERLCDTLGIEKPKRSEAAEKRAAEVRAAENAAEVMHAAAMRALWGGEDGAGASGRAASALAWLHSRGISADVARSCGLGLLAGWDVGARALDAAGVAADVAAASGLVKPRKSGAGVYDALHHCVVFPLRRAGRVVSLRGRAVPGWPENEGAPKSRAPSGGGAPRLWVPAGSTWAERGAVVLVEGEMDALSLAAAGVACVAVLGSGLDATAAETLGRLRCERLLIWPDADAAGARLGAAVAAAVGERAWLIGPGVGKAGQSLRAHKDANAAHMALGLEAFGAAVRAAMDAAAPWLESECARLRALADEGGATGLASARGAVGAVVEVVAARQEGMERERAIGDVARLLGKAIVGGVGALRAEVARAAGERLKAGAVGESAAGSAGKPKEEEAGGTAPEPWAALLDLPAVEAARAARARAGGALPSLAEVDGQWGGLDPAAWVPIPEGGELSEVADGRRVAMLHGDALRFVEGYEAWAVYDGARWAVRGAAARAEALAEDVAALHAAEVARLQEAANEAGKDEAARIAGRLKSASAAMGRCLTARGRRGVLDAARTVPGIVVHARDFDADPWALCCPNGVVDLRTGKLRPHRRSDLHSRVAGVAYEPDAPRGAFERFLLSVASGSQDPAAWVRFVQRWFGYCLSGDVREQVFVYGWGAGSNGKGTLLRAIARAMGDYVQTAPPGLLEVQEGGERHPVELADLVGARLVTIHEVEARKQLAESRVKTLTGCDTIRARRLNQDFFEFDPVAKFMATGNARPKIRGTDQGIWRRLLLLPFAACFADPSDPGRPFGSVPFEPGIGEALARESGGALAWCVEGARLWLEGGLGVPAECRAAVADLREASDPFGAFLGEACIEEPGASVSISELHQAFCLWLKARKEAEWSLTLFGRRIGDRGMERRKTKWGIVLAGYRIDPLSEPAIALEALRAGGGGGGWGGGAGGWGSGEGGGGAAGARKDLGASGWGAFGDDEN
jgi:P4 family phage/plasmid primase-like protien